MEALALITAWGISTNNDIGPLLGISALSSASDVSGLIYVYRMIIISKQWK